MSPLDSADATLFRNLATGSVSEESDVLVVLELDAVDEVLSVEEVELALCEGMFFSISAR